MARRERLGVWYHDLHVADLTSQSGSDVWCTYTPEALDRFPGNTPLLSCSLLVRPRKQDASVFFSGLLPEGQHRQAMAALARIPTYDTHGLLARFGRDVAGALVIGTTPPAEHAGSVEPYTRDALAEEVSSLPQRPLALHDDSELSLAGLQDKLLLVDLGNREWGRPRHGTPSTHILKVEERRHPGMARAEADCLALARAIDLTTVEADVETIADVSCLIVSRFDRVIKHGTVERIHQEDLCQALARDPEANGNRGKYEDAHGPSLRDAASLLDRYASDADVQLDRLVAATTFTIVIGNADAHGKNLALLHREPGIVELAPLYDTVPTSLWPNLRARGAMSVNGSWELSTLTLDDIAHEAAQWRHDRNRALAVATETAERVRAAVDTVLSPDSAVAAYVKARADDLLSSR